ncbi:hypothetical protein LSAT2_018185 [Lamellibrachia satsuma]|nr:hypothetical protein LSAT2_018185 [Lamellibrachia satsuma]
MASRETAVAALFLVFSCNMCCGDVGETVAALTRSRHNASRRRNPVKRHAFDDKPEPLSRVYVNETVWKTTGSSCISSCETLVDTDYQSCIGCHVFARCINHKIHDNNPCVKTYYQWDSYRRSCHLGTKTCKLVIGYSPCRSSPCKNGADCKSKVDGGKEVVCTCKEGYAGKNCEEASSRDFSTKTKVVAGVGVGALAAGTVVAAAYVASTGGSGAAAATTAPHHYNDIFVLDNLRIPCILCPVPP